MNFRPVLENQIVGASVPCRVDFGGTLDISTFYLCLGHEKPSTVNFALDLRTHVTLLPWDDGRVKVSSRGFEPADFPALEAPFDHPLGLMFAVAGFFNAQGVHIQIRSTSPVRSALGGSSAAAVALVAAFSSALGREVDPAAAALAAHTIESSVAGVPCGLQDQLAAAFGGVNQWNWFMGSRGPEFTRESLDRPEGDPDSLDAHMIVAYCGIPHVSKDINKQWVNQFLSGQNRGKWVQIAWMARAFADAVRTGDFARAGELMNLETRLRLEMTPEVLDGTGRKLFDLAGNSGCGARFTGAGGGGCIWAMGDSPNIRELKGTWTRNLSDLEDAQVLDTVIDPHGIQLK
ncbi:MAG: galactokinase [Pseudomonadota bacterium]